MLNLPSITRMCCLGALALGLAGGLSAARGTLHLDGILQIRGGAASSAKIIVLPTGGMPYAMDNVSGRFTMSLPLDGTYLLSFERDGLVTKQVYFDTTVPIDKHASELSFPFKVTLFSVGKNDVYAYAGPVGIVHYDAGKQDFDHETDYTLKPGVPMFQRITTLMAQMEARGADGLPIGAVITYRASNGSAGGMAVADVGAPTGTEADRALPEPVMEALKTSSDDAIVDLPESMPRGPAEPVPLASAPSSMEELDLASRIVRKPLETADARPRMLRQKPSASEAVPAVDPLTLPAEELIVERNRVTTVVRVPEATGQVSEYRRVADRHGMVVHFRDGVQIPEQLYREGTGR